MLSELLGSTGVELGEAVEVEKHGGLEGAFCSVFMSGLRALRWKYWIVRMRFGRLSSDVALISRYALACRCVCGLYVGEDTRMSSLCAEKERVCLCVCRMWGPAECVR